MANIQELSKSMTDKVSERVKELEQQGELQLPADYSASNACRSAFLQLQEVKDKNNRPALEVVSKSSLFNALLNMVTQGLTPAKDQGYFIVYGQKLVFQPSYFGNIALAQRMAGVKDVYPQVIYDKDEFDYDITHSRITNIKHEQSFKNKLNGNIVGAYCTIIFDDDRPSWTELMTINDIKKAWSQGNYNPDSKYKGAHENFTEEMAKKTIINRALKKYIKSSSDAHLNLEEDRAFNNDEVKSEIIEEEKEEKNASEEFIEAEVVDNDDNDTKEEPELNKEDTDISEDDVDKALDEDEMPWND